MNAEKLNRRQFLKTTGGKVAASLLTIGSLGAIAEQSAYGNTLDDFDRYDFLIGRVKFPIRNPMPDWSQFPGAELNLLTEFSSVVRCKVKLPQGCNNRKPYSGRDSQFNLVVDFSDIKNLQMCPFLLMTSEHNYELSSKEKQNLKQYIHRGGFLVMDDCIVENGGNFFYHSSFKILEDTFGPGSVKRIPKDHEVFHNVYDFDNEGMPYLIGQNHGARGVFVGDRLAVFLSANDLHCAWTPDMDSYRRKRRYIIGIKMGINIIMYAISH